VWVPGAAPLETPAGTGTPIAAGSAIVLQMHYHPTGFEHAPDQTKVKLRTESTAPGKTFLFTALGNAFAAPNLLPGPGDLGSPRFLIPAGASDHTETMEFPINVAALGDRRVPMTAMIAHMHYVGVDMQARIERQSPAPAESQSECLINVRDWDFDWQRTYTYDAPIDRLPTLGNGDKVTLRCTYDNTEANPFVRRMLLEEGLPEPVDVSLGEQTTDEMCIAIMGLVF
jgi:hypothetical protein